MITIFNKMEAYVFILLKRRIRLSMSRALRVMQSDLELGNDRMTKNYIWDSSSVLLKE